MYTVGHSLQVLDMQSYETRQKEYACKGQKHFYFMTLNGNEVNIFPFNDSAASFSFSLIGIVSDLLNKKCVIDTKTDVWLPECVLFLILHSTFREVKFHLCKPFICIFISITIFT